MSENFASFYRKASSVRELVGKAPFPEKARFQITKVIELPANQYRRYMNELFAGCFLHIPERDGYEVRWENRNISLPVRDLPRCKHRPAGGVRRFWICQVRGIYSLKRVLSHWRVFRWNAQAKSAFAGIRPRRDDFFLRGSGQCPPNIAITIPLENKAPRSLQANAAVAALAQA